MRRAVKAGKVLACQQGVRPRRGRSLHGAALWSSLVAHPVILSFAPLPSRLWGPCFDIPEDLGYEPALVVRSSGYSREGSSSNTFRPTRLIKTWKDGCQVTIDAPTLMNRVLKLTLKAHPL